MNEDSFLQLLVQYDLGQCTEEERVLVESWYIAHAKAIEQEEEIQGRSDAYLPSKEQQSGTWKTVMKNTGLTIPAHRPPVRRLFYWSAAAAVIFLLAGAWLYSVTRPARDKPAVVAKADAAPGDYKAILTLADGNTINLADVPAGILTSQGNTKLVKTVDGRLRYSVADATGTDAGSAMMNVLNTPRGGQYHLVLADGTGVWLNAASSIRYPVSFGEKERKVVVMGEAFFEVSAEIHKPFIVIAGEDTIRVLGTKFNVSLYADEPVRKTTLLSGKIEVLSGGQTLILGPAQQARRKDSDKATIVSGIDTDAELAWRAGDFDFSNQSLQEIMRNIARWYDVRVVYDGTPADLRFGGIVSRSKPLSEVLRIMEDTGEVHFKLEKKTLMVITKG